MIQQTAEQLQQQQGGSAPDENSDEVMTGADDDTSAASDVPMPKHAFAFFEVLGKKIYAYSTPTKKKMKNNKTKQTETVQTTADTTKPPKVPSKLKHLAGHLETQPTELQWIIVEKFKTMLDLNEKLSRKVDSLSNEKKQTHYYDKFDLESDEKPKKKPFIHTCLRDAPKLTCSKRVRSDDRVDDIYADISNLQQEGIGLQDQLKNKLANMITQVTKLEVTALRRLLVLEYWELAVFMAGCTVFELSKPTKGGFVQKTKELDILILNILELHLVEVPGKDWVNILHYDSQIPENNARNSAATELLRHFNITDATNQVNARFDPADDNLLHAASVDLKKTMKAITFKVFEDVAAAKADAKAVGEKIKFLGIGRVKLKNNKMSERLEAGDGEDVVANIACKEAKAVLAQDNSRRRREARKNCSGEQKGHAQTPAKNGQSGRQPTARGRERSSRRSNHRSASRSPASSASARSRSTKRKSARPGKKSDRRSQSRPRRRRDDDCHSQNGNDDSSSSSGGDDKDNSRNARRRPPKNKNKNKKKTPLKKKSGRGRGGDADPAGSRSRGKNKNGQKN